MNTTAMQTGDRPTETVAAFLVRRSEELGLSATDVIEQLGIPVRSWELMCAGQMKIPFERIEPLARALQVAPDDFLTRVLRDYLPGLLALLERLYCADKPTSAEMLVVKQLRALGGSEKAFTVIPASKMLFVVGGEA